MSQHNTGMLNAIEQLQAKNGKIVVVSTLWNDDIINEMYNGCMQFLSAHEAQIIEHIKVPGAFEIPYMCKQIWNKLKNTPSQPEAIIALGAVIRGGTPHFDYVCQAVTDGIVQLNLSICIPTIFGILTVDNEAQAWERLGGIHGHKGTEAGMTALLMIEQNRKMAQIKNL